MSFLKGGLGDFLGTLSPALGMATGKGLGGELLPHQERPLADRIGTAANQIATTGGADPGYFAPPAVGATQPARMAAPQGAPTNHFQYLDDATLRKLIPGYQPTGGAY